LYLMPGTSNLKITQSALDVFMEEMRHGTATLYPLVGRFGGAGEGWRASIGPRSCEK
jgi:hypothetical protein